MLIDNNKACDFEWECSECEYYDITPCFAGRMADALIANGVTFATDNNVPCKWVPVSERLPKKTGWYRVCHKSKLISDRYFYSDSPEAFARFGSDPVTHWKPIEEPPKEGE